MDASAARFDKSDPVLVLTRELVRPHPNTVTVAPITTVTRGLSTEVLCGAANGLDERCAVVCDHITPRSPLRTLGRQIGRLLDEQQGELADTIHACVVVAAALVPTRSGAHVKTDPRAARKLA